MTISKDIKYVGINDNDIDLFESQYKVPNGISYNSYIIFDEKIALMDTVDIRKYDEWEKVLDKELDGKEPTYLVIHHLEPDHAGSIKKIMEKFPNITLVGNAKTFAMLPQFFDGDFQNTVTVKEGDTLSLGSHTLTFVLAPMVHWPEVMVSYEMSEKVLFSADAFGKFGSLDKDEEWLDEARRYYINIVGKYGKPVTTLLKKASGLDIKTICPLHGPVLKDNLAYYIDLYLKWSSYTPEVDGVLIAYASIYSNTKITAMKLFDILSENGVKAEIIDIAREDIASSVAKAFKYSKMICASPTYDGGIFAPMADFIHHLSMKTYQNRTVGFIENGSWGPICAKFMKESFEKMQNITFYETVVTIKSSLKDNSEKALNELASEIISK